METSIPQMANRAQWSHWMALRNIAAGGYPKCSKTTMATLHRWGAVDTEAQRPYRSTLTATGEALLDALNSRG